MADPRLVACRAGADYRLWLRFADGLEGTVSCEGLLDIGAFKLWRDVREFARVHVDLGGRAITWAAGVRLDPEILYQDIVARGGKPRSPRRSDPAFARFLLVATRDQDGPVGPLHRQLRGGGRSPAAKRARARRQRPGQHRKSQ